MDGYTSGEDKKILGNFLRVFASLPRPLQGDRGPQTVPSDRSNAELQFTVEQTVWKENGGELKRLADMI
ncbi:MAG: hypothetical protein V2G42_04275 [bacterium JZ-2024 1]